MIHILAPSPLMGDPVRTRSRRLMNAAAYLLCAICASGIVDTALAQSVPLSASTINAITSSKNGDVSVDSSQIAPSDAANPTLPRADRPVPRRRPHESASLQKENKNLLPRKAPVNAPRLCFQPGTGWIELPPPSASAEEYAAKPGDGSTKSDSPGTKTSELRPRKISGAQVPSLEATECSSAISYPVPNPSQNAGLHNGQLLSDYRSVPDKGFVPSGLSKELPGLDGTYNGNSSLATQSDHDSFRIHRQSALGSPSVTPIDQLKLLENRAYISPVKLRKLSRNVPDLQTRLKLRQLQTKVENEKNAAPPDDPKILKMKDLAKQKELERQKITLAHAAEIAKMNRHHH